MLPADGLYKYLYQPSEQHGDKKKVATNFIRSKNTYRLDQIVKDLGNRVFTIGKVNLESFCM